MIWDVIAPIMTSLQCDAISHLWSLSHNWFRQWLGAFLAPSHCLNQRRNYHWDTKDYILLSIASKQHLWCAEFILANIILYICILYHYSTLRWHRWLKCFFMEVKNLFILHSQHHGCWCPGDFRSQGISSNGIDLVLLQYPSLSTRRK